MNKKVRLDRLKKLHDLLINHDRYFPKIKFDLDCWGNDENEELPGRKGISCLTSACALGSAGLYPPFRRAGLQTTVDKWDGVSVIFEHAEGFCAGQNFFGLSRTESNWLFNPSYYYFLWEGEYVSPTSVDNYDEGDEAGDEFVDSISPSIVAVRVQHLINHYTKYGQNLIGGTWDLLDEEELPLDYVLMGLPDAK